MNAFEELAERIKTRVGLRDPQAVALAVRIGVDAAALTARAAAGEDVERELLVVHASAKNLDQHVRYAVFSEAFSFMTDRMTSALLAAIHH